MALPRAFTAPIGRALQTVGRYNDYVLPGQGSSRATNAGRSITDRNQVYVGGSPFDGQASWVQVQNPVTNTGGGQTSGGANAGGGDNAQVSGSGAWSSTGRSGGSAPAIDWADVAASQEALNQANFQLGQIPGQRGIGLQNISDVFTNYRNTINGQKGINERNYNTNRTQTIQDNERARAAIDATTRQRAAALQRYMGAMGAGDSEAARILAPYAAARTGTKQREQVATEYGRNLSAMDTGWQDYLGQYNTQLQELAQQEKERRDALESELLTKQYEAMDRKRQAESALAYSKSGNAAQARAIREGALAGMYQILQQIDGLKKQYSSPVVAKDITYKAIDPATYNVEKNADIAGGAPTQEQIDPSYQYLLFKNKDDQNIFGY